MVPCTIRIGRTFGSTCSMVIRKLPLPEARAASTNSRAQIALADPRVSRTRVGIWKMPMAMIEVTMPGPATAASMMAESTAGNAKVKSLIRMMSSSVQPLPAEAARHDAAHDGGASADQQQRDDIAAEPVGAEPVRRRRWPQLGGHVDFI